MQNRGEINLSEIPWQNVDDNLQYFLVYQNVVAEFNISFVFPD